MNRAALYILTSTSLFSIINVAVKYLDRLPASEIVTFRGAVSLILCLTFLFHKKSSIWGQNKKLLLLRGLFGSVALFGMFACLQNIPLAVAMTLINLTPIFSVLIAHVVLGEKAHGLQWLCLLFCFVGVILVRGQLEPVPLFWMAMGVGVALCAAGAYTCVRKLRTTEDPLVVILYFPLVTIPLVGPVMVHQWVTPKPMEWLFLLGIGLLTQVAQYFMTLGYQMEKAANVMIFNYVSLFWGVLLGWVIFNESLENRQILGVLIVFFCLCGSLFFGNSKRGKDVSA